MTTTATASSTSSTQWAPLLSDLKDTLTQGAKSISVDRNAWQKAIDSLDRLIDEIKSEDHIPKEHVPLILSLFYKIFQFGKDTVDYWPFKHMCLFALCHVYAQYQDHPELLMKLLKETQGISSQQAQEPSDTTADAAETQDRLSKDAETPVSIGQNSFLSSCLLACIEDPKREVRDAVAQNFGALVAVTGNQLIDEILPPMLEEFKAGTKEAFEGLMMTCGYLASHCTDISESSWNTLTELLVVEAENTQFGSYSRYVRMNAIHGLTQVMQAPTAATFSSHANMQLIKKAMRERMKDEDIDVRRAVGHLFEAYYTFFTKVEEDPIRLLHDMLDYCIETVKEEGNERWEVRHGVACALEQVTQSPKIVEVLTVEAVENLMNMLKDVIRKEDQDKSSFSSNAVAGLALTHLLITLVKYSTAEKLVSRLFEEYGKPDLEFMLQSAHPQLLDAAARCIDLLITHANRFVSPHMERFMSLLFKNRYHAAYPIRSSASTIWRKSYNLVFETTHETEQQLLTHLTPQLLDVLLESSKHTNYEVRETVYQALSDVLRYTESSVPAQEENVKRLYANLLNAANDMTGGANSDYPRAASIRALASMLLYCSKHNVTALSGHVSEIDTLIRERLEVLDETLVVKATLKVVEVVAAHWRDLFGESSLAFYAAHTYKISHMIYEDEIRFAAVPAYLNCFGKKRSKVVGENSQFVQDFIAALQGQFDEEKEELEREAVARILRDLSPMDFSHIDFSQKSVQTAMQLLADGLTLEENAENLLIKSSCLLFLRALVRENTSFCKEMISQSDLYHKLMEFTFKTLRGEEEFSESPEAEFSLVESPDWAEVCFQILVPVLASSASDESKRGLYVSILSKTIATYSANDDFSSMLAQLQLQSSLSALGIEANLKQKEDKTVISSTDTFVEAMKKMALAQEWDDEEDSENDQKVLLASDALGFRYGSSLVSGMYSKQNQIIDAAQRFVQEASSEQKVALLKQIAQDMKQNDNEEQLQNELLTLHFILTSANMSDAVKQSELIPILEAQMESSDEKLVWLAYGAAVAQLSDADFDAQFIDKIASADWRVELSQKHGESVVSFAAIVASMQAVAFYKKDEKKFSAALQTLSDVLNDLNIVEDKSFIKYGVEQMVDHIGPQVTPDPTPASDKSNSTFVSS